MAGFGLACVLAVMVSAQAATNVEKVPFTRDETLCNGDTVHFTGTLLITTTSVENAAGGTVVGVRHQPMNARGVDQTTGTVFRGVGTGGDLTVTLPNGGSTETTVNVFHLQATQGAESFVVRAVFHITVASDGTVIVRVDRVSATC
ncbi:MAG: hypothetical protein P8Y02_05210 [Deinococcales bacterium]